MEYNKIIDLSKSYLFCQIQKSKNPNLNKGNSEKYLPFITISREAGSGESRISESLADYLSKNAGEKNRPWTSFDKDLIKKVVEDYHVSGITGLLPEEKFSEIQTMFEELFGLHPTKREMAHNLSKTILNLAKMGNTIIVGRGAFYITRHLESGLHVRLIGSKTRRIKHMVEEYQMTLKQADEYIKKEDKERYEYVKKLFGVDLNDPHYYDLVINTDELPFNEIVRIIAGEVSRLKNRLSLQAVAESSHFTTV
jgi:cytidylate kinase